MEELTKQLNHLKYFNIELDQVDLEIEKLSNEITTLNNRLNLTLEENEQLKNVIFDLSSKHNKTTKDFNTSVDNNWLLTKENSELKSQVQDLNKKIETNENTIRELQSIQDLKNEELQNQNSQLKEENFRLCFLIKNQSKNGWFKSFCKWIVKKILKQRNI